MKKALYFDILNYHSDNPALIKKHLIPLLFTMDELNGERKK